MGRQLITEQDVLDAERRGAKVLFIESNSMITAAANDAARKYRIEFSVQVPSPKIPVPSAEVTNTEGTLMTALSIAIGSDHGGFQMKEMLKQFLGNLGYRLIDVGTDSEQACDYPDFAYAVASLVSSGKVDRGIMIDGVGVASAIVANKVPGVRAVPCYDEFVARSSREHNDANVLTLGGRVIGIEIAKTIVKLWLNTSFSSGRHLPRVNKIRDVENRFLKPLS